MFIIFTTKITILEDRDLWLTEAGMHNTEWFIEPVGPFAETKKTIVSINQFVEGPPLKMMAIFRDASLKRPVSENMPKAQEPVTYIYVT